MLRILIVDDQKSIRETLKIVLESEPDLEVVGTANDGSDAIALARKLMPDLMLVDLEMPGIDGLELTQTIDRDFPSIKVIVLSMHERDEYIQRSLQAGAMGYFLKNTPAEDLKEAIRLVSRGYTQFSPGLIHKVFPAVETKAVKRVEISQPQPLTLEPIELYKPAKNRQRRIRKSWKTYLPYWLAGNLAIWGLAILYLTFKSPTYISKWSISLPAKQNSSSVSIPDIGSVSSSVTSAYGSSIYDPRESYKFLLEKKQILIEAAQKVGMKRDKFGEPNVQIVDNTTMMELSMEGETPEEAQAKAIAIQTVLEQKLEELRQGQISQSDLSLQASLAKAESSLSDARQKLAQFKAETAIGASDREGNLSSNIETLRRQQAEVRSQLQQARAQAQRLADSLGLSPQIAKDAFALHSDSLFQKYLSEYTRTSGELISLEAKFQANNPLVVNKTEEVNAARNALVQRGEVLLGSRPSNELLQQLNLRTGDENDSYRGSLLKDVVSMQSEAQGLAAHAAELDQQIARLEAKENNLVQQRSTLSKLEQNVKFAETVYSSNLAKSRLAESNLFDAYPQIQVAIEPSLPKSPSSPNPVLVSLGAFMGSLFLTTALASLWSSSTQTVTLSNNNSNNHHKALAPDESLNRLQKK